MGSEVSVQSRFTKVSDKKIGVYEDKVTCEMVHPVEDKVQWRAILNFGFRSSSEFPENFFIQLLTINFSIKILCH
jgi:hypothetical protein